MNPKYTARQACCFDCIKDLENTQRYTHHHHHNPSLRTFISRGWTLSTHGYDNTIKPKHPTLYGIYDSLRWTPAHLPFTTTIFFPNPALSSLSLSAPDPLCLPVSPHPPCFSCLRPTSSQVHPANCLLGFKFQCFLFCGAFLFYSPTLIPTAPHFRGCFFFDF